MTSRDVPYLEIAGLISEHYDMAYVICSQPDYDCCFVYTDVTDSWKDVLLCCKCSSVNNVGLV